jgi:hypothetical protein
VLVLEVKNIAEMGAYAALLEYNSIEGMILLSELSRRRIRSISSLIKVGRQEPVMVLRVDKEKGYIDFSKRRVSKEDVFRLPFKYTNNLLALYDEVEVPRDRLLFKIPATWHVCFILNGIYTYIFVVYEWCRDAISSEGYAFWWQI